MYRTKKKKKELIQRHYIFDCFKDKLPLLQTSTHWDVVHAEPPTLSGAAAEIYDSFVHYYPEINYCNFSLIYFFIHSSLEVIAWLSFWPACPAVHQTRLRPSVTLYIHFKHYLKTSWIQSTWQCWVHLTVQSLWVSQRMKLLKLRGPFYISS